MTDRLKCIKWREKIQSENGLKKAYAEMIKSGSEYSAFLLID